MRLLLTPLAGQDLEEIGDYIAQDNPTRAHSFVRSWSFVFSHLRTPQGSGRLK